MEDALTRLLEHVDRDRPGDLRGAYLYGSAVSGGLRADSDLDILLLTARSLTDAERAALTDLLLHVGPGRRAARLHARDRSRHPRGDRRR